MTHSSTSIILPFSLSHIPIFYVFLDTNTFLFFLYCSLEAHMCACELKALLYIIDAHL